MKYSILILIFLPCVTHALTKPVISKKNKDALAVDKEDQQIIRIDKNTGDTANETIDRKSEKPISDLGVTLLVIFAPSAVVIVLLLGVAFPSIWYCYYNRKCCYKDRELSLNEALSTAQQSSESVEDAKPNTLCGIPSAIPNTETVQSVASSFKDDFTSLLREKNNKTVKAFPHSVEAAKPTHQTAEATKQTPQTAEAAKTTSQMAEAAKSTLQTGEATKPISQIAGATKRTHQIAEDTKRTYQISETTKPTQQISEATKPTHQITETTKLTHQIAEGTNKDNYY